VAFFLTDEAEIDAVGKSGIGKAAGDEFGSDAGGVAGGESEDRAHGHAQ
jgi:hypothetical protein